MYLYIIFLQFFAVETYFYGGYTIVFHKTRLSYLAALNACARDYSGGELLYITSSSLQKFVDERLGQIENEIPDSGWDADIFAPGYWIGGSDRRIEGRWVWLKLIFSLFTVL